MAFTAKQFGRKLATIRTAFGQDRESLALSSGIQAERLALLEDGAADPTGDEVLILADRFKKNFRYFLADDATDPDADIEFLFRTNGDELPPADRIAISEFVYLCRCQATLERDLARRPSHPGFRFHPVGGFFKGHGQRCAAELRRHLGLNDNEVVRDVFGAMRSMGLARTMRIGFMTDDQKARAKAADVNVGTAHTTPHLFGWLIHEGALGDGDHSTVIAEHEASVPKRSGRLSKHFRAAYEEACRCRLVRDHVIPAAGVAGR
jgi:transcriptional regulator with XRE-family HTH domain